MLSNLSLLLVHFVGAALACAQLAYWSVRLTTAPALPAPATAKVTLVRDPDPVLAARAFGLIEQVAVSASNVQVAGVFSAGKDSAAVISVDDRPPRAILLGQEVSPGSTLVGVDAKGVTLESGGVRRQLRVPEAPSADLAASAQSAPSAAQRIGNVLTAPSVAGGNDVRSVRAPGQRPAFSPPGAPLSPPRPPNGASPTAQ